MTEKRYYSVDYDEQYYIFDSDVIRKGRVEEEAEYSYDVFADSMTGDEVVNKLNEQDKLIRKLRAEVEVHKHPLFSTRQAEEKIERYESDLRMCREKALYWRNKAEDIFGDMRTNVELKRENEQLKKEYNKLKHRHSLLHDECLELEKNSEKAFLKIIDDYFIKCGDDGVLFNLHKPSDIRSLVYLMNRANGYSELQCEYNDLTIGGDVE